MDFFEKIVQYSFWCYVVSFSLVLVFFFIDWRKKRKLKEFEDISVLIPCYNAGESIELTIKSLFDSYPKKHIQLIIIDDKSTDTSFQKLQQLQEKYDFQLLSNEVNL